MKLDFTNLEKYAIVRVLTDIVRADDRIDMGEMAYFAQIQKLLEISDNEFQLAMEMSVAISIATIRKMSEIKKSALALMMHQMITADGNIDEEEMKVFVAVCALGQITVPEELVK